MSEESLEPRVRSLEERMNLHEVLRTSQDRDLPAVEVRTREIRRQLEAVSATVGLHSVILERHRVILERHGVILDEHSARLDRIDQNLSRTNDLLGEFALDTIARFRQTESRFEAVDTRFDGVEGRLSVLESGQAAHGRLLGEILAKVDRVRVLESGLADQGRLLEQILAKVDRRSSGSG